jgi:hypothetical protein
MGRYKETLTKTAEITGPPPIWRGIGCLLIILVPVMSFAAADLSWRFFWLRGLIPQELLVTPQPPDWIGLLPVVQAAYWFVFSKEAILAILVLTVIYTIFLAGIISVFYAFMYRLTAPSKYGPLDAPPPRIKVKKYKR